ncbi:glycerophosphodiester phosphodiesterase [Angustibacter peucedani]
MSAAPRRWDGSRPFEVQGHRGARGLRPENTLAGIACALEVGVSSVECDVALTEDDAVVLTHGAAVPSAAEPVPVRSLPLTELRQVDLGDLGRPDADPAPAFRSEPGQRMATLGGAIALLDLFEAHDVRLDVEIKSARHSDPRWDAEHVVDRVLGEIRSQGALDRCTVRSFDLDVLHEVRRRDPRLRRVLLVGRVEDHAPPELAVGPDVRPDDLVALADELDAVAVAPGRSLATAELVAVAHERDLPVIPWTINDLDRLDELVDAGADGVCTDRPDLVREALQRRGIEVPARHRAPSWLGYGWATWPDPPAGVA